MFVLSQTDPLRIYVNVPQAYAQSVKPGQKVTVTQSELQGQAFEGQVARTSGAIDPATRTMQIEVTLPNRDGVLMPGAYVQVQLPLRGAQAMTVPANALLIYRKISDLDPNSINVHVKLADLYSQNNQTGEALKEYDRVGRMLAPSK